MCAGSTVFVRNVIGDMMMCDAFHDMEVALYYLWYSRDLGATADGRHAGDAPKGLLERSPSGLPKNFQRIFSWCEHGALNRKAYVTFPFGESS